jgi:hypothetical protein
MSEDTGVPEIIRSKLLAGERLSWWDQPDPQLLGRREVGVQTLFGGFMLAFSCFWLYNAAQAGGFFALFGVPFVAVAIWILTAPVRARRAAASTLYALTDQRALILSPRRTSAHPLRRAEFVETESLENGFGHVLFFNEAPASPFSTFNTTGQQIRKSGFLGIADADRVARELQDGIAAASGHRVERQG